MIDYEFEPDPSDTNQSGTCLECGRDCQIVYEDEGIGFTEFWGAGEVVAVMCASSDCCAAEVV